MTSLDLLRTPIEDGVTVIEASAGTGKTFCLTGLVLRLLLERRVEHVGQLLVVTFTQAATEELVGRIRAALRDVQSALAGESAPRDEFVAGLVARHGGRAENRDGEETTDGAEILRRALLDFDDLTVSTLHGFCRRVLEESAFESGLPFDTELVESDDALLLDAGRDVWRRLFADADALLAAVATARGWSPATFLVDYREIHRHPSTVLLPATRGLQAARADITEAATRLRRAFDRARLRLELQDLPFREGRSDDTDLLADRQRVRSLLATLRSALERETGPEDGAEDGDAILAESLWALEPLRSSSLRRALPESHHREIARRAALARFVPAVDALFAALDGLEHAVRARFVDQVERRFAEIKARGATLAFDDLLHRLADALADPRHGRRLTLAVRRRFRAALIDEFQDTDLVQYGIFRRLFGPGPLFLVGDPKQAIYRFRGADIFAYLEAKREASRLYGLERNWRTGAPLLEAVHAVFAEAPRPFVFADVPFQAVEAAPRTAGRALEGDGGKPLEWRWLEDSSQARAEIRLHDATANEIANQLASAAAGRGPELVGDGGGRPLRPGDIAVLVRTNRQALDLQTALRRAGVPAVVSRSGDIFESDEMEELLRLLDAVLEPSSARALRVACATLVWGFDAADLTRLGEADAELQALVERFDAYRLEWQRRGFVAMVERLVIDRDVRRRLLGLDGGERRLTNFFHAVEVLHRALHERHLTPAGLVTWARAERRLADHDLDTAELRLESDARAVTITTVHKSKGLEYEVVFCPFLWQGRPVAERPVLAHVTDDRVVYDCGSENLEAHRALAEAERLAEDLRLAYVALTRARRRTVVAWGPVGRGPASAASALAYLLHRRQGRLAPADSSPIDEATWVEGALAEVRARKDHWFRDLQTFVGDHAEHMGLAEIPESDDGEGFDVETDEESEDRSEDLGVGTADLHAVPIPDVTRLRLVPWRISSFSSLARGGEREMPDHADPAVPALAAAESKPVAPEGIFAFARGPRAGDCLHRVLEAIDFRRLGRPDTAAAVRRELERFRLDEPSQHLAPLDPERAVLDMLDAVLASPLPGESFALAEIGRADRLVEWQFHLPLRPIAPRELGDLFREHAATPWAAEYAERLDRLGRYEIEGFLTGYVDLVFAREGRFFLVDWKSNHLGDHAAAYDLDAMTTAMLEHHYPLQYHLYAVALRRFLRERIPDFDPARDLGGAYYVFLRGAERRAALSPTPASRQLDLFAASESTSGDSTDPAAADGAVRGFFHDRPSVALLDALEARLTGGISSPGLSLPEL